MTDNTTKFTKTQGFTLVELLVVIAIIAIIAGLVVPSLMNAQSSAFKLQCMANLRGLQQSSYQYASKKNRFPIAKGKEPRAHESFNSLRRTSAGRGLEYNVFRCTEGGGIDADYEEDDDGNQTFELEEENVDYMWIIQSRKLNQKGLLSADKYIDGFVDDAGDERVGHKDSIQAITLAGKAIEIDMVSEEDGNDLEKYRVDLDTLIPRGLTR